MSTTNDAKSKIAKIKESAGKKHVTAHNKATKRTAGRKPKPKGEKYDRRTVVYFKDDQFDLINDYCDLLGISVNEFIRDTVMQKLNKEETEDVIDTFIENIDEKKLGEHIKEFLRG